MGPYTGSAGALAATGGLIGGYTLTDYGHFIAALFILGILLLLQSHARNRRATDRINAGITD